MTIDNELNRKEYDPDGVVAVFAYNFRVDDADDLVVKEDGVVVVGGYTVSDVGNPAGGDVTFDVAPLDSVDVLTLIRDVPITQETAYPALGPFPANSHEAALDKLTMIVQDQQEKLDRAVLTSTNQGPLFFPDPVAGKRIQWLADLSGFENVDSESDEAEFWAGEAEDFADDSATFSNLSSASAFDANNSAVSASGFADDAAASAAAAALYNPTWGAWIDITLTTNFTNKTPVLPLQYRLSSDGLQVQFQGVINNSILIPDNNQVNVFAIPAGILDTDDSVSLTPGFYSSPTFLSGVAVLRFGVADAFALRSSVDIPIGADIQISGILGRR